MYIVDEKLERKEILSRYKHLIRLVSNTATREQKKANSQGFCCSYEGSLWGKTQDR